MKQRLFLLLLVLALVFSQTTSAAAQTYYFQMPTELVHVYLNTDGTMALDYYFTFANDASADAIEFVDVGMPNGNYDFGSISAEANGKALKVSSDYKGEGAYGVAVEMGAQAIKPGKSGTVRVYVGRIERMIYPDDNDQNYASSEFSPTWFGSEFVHGKTDLTVVFHLPQGVQPKEPRWHAAPSGFPSEPETGIDTDGRVTYTWQNPSASGSTQYKFGASFPKTSIPESAIVTTSFLDIIFGGIALIVGGISQIFPFLCFGGLFFGIPMLSTISERKRKLQYIKPSISIEGHGIKRGLTAVEAAILMGQPLDKVMTMMLFSATKKGALQVVKRDPLTVELLTPQPETLQFYEKEFIQSMAKDERPRRKDLQTMTVNLIKSVTDKMKGFSQKETLDYYKSINDKAWQQIEAAGTPEVKSQMFEEAIEWTMLDKDYDDRARRTFTGPVYVPMWWGRYDPGYGGSVSTGTSMPSVPVGSGGRVSLPGADFAASVVGGVQNFSSRVLGNVNDFTSGVTNVTNPPPPPPKSSGRSGGGGGCACACAGCACACAGGGR